MRLPLLLFIVSAAAIAAFWTWLGTPVALPPSPLAQAEKLYCVSYAPYRPGQSPFDVPLRLNAPQIEQDIASLSRLTDCVRTYASDFGDFVAESAARHGVKVMQGIWIGRNAVDNQKQVDDAVALANRFPNVIRSIVVGNEVLLRGEMAEAALADTIRGVKARVKVPVTYADVWEYWLRHRDIAQAVDFVTVHILPYWEDFPIPAHDAGPHVASIYRHVAGAFPGKEVIIGEVGWPSEGRMREGALPSPANQARVIQDVLAAAKRDKIHVNVIEAFDQPWKRLLEGTVGGHWGFLDAYARTFKFAWGQPVSNHPFWKAQAAFGVAYAALVFGAAFFAARRRHGQPAAIWIAVAVNAAVGGALIGWTFVTVPMESFDAGGWLRTLALATVAFAAPVVGSAALTAQTPLPAFSRILNPARGGVRDSVALAFGVTLMVLTLLAILTALGLVFSPRYRDFPFAAITAAAVPFLLHSALMPRPAGGRSAAEAAGAGILALSVVYIFFNESFANWQSLWLCAALAALAVTLARMRDARD